MSTQRAPWARERTPDEIAESIANSKKAREITRKMKNETDVIVDLEDKLGLITGEIAEIKGYKGPGIYVVHWKSGGCSYALITLNARGELLFGCANQVNENLVMLYQKVNDISHMVCRGRDSDIEIYGTGTAAAPLSESENASDDTDPDMRPMTDHSSSVYGLLETWHRTLPPA